MKPTRRLLIQKFSPEATPLRNHYDKLFADPKSASSNRFVWDYFHVEGQYSHLRTPAYHFFPKSSYRRLHQQIVQWGRENLGCHDISPPWLSSYTDGCYQGAHADVPHGPWAFVLSLTTNKDLIGGETFLFQEEVLSYWSGGHAGLEEHRILEKIPPRFNQLLVFDPALPHGVTTVRGTRSPVEGRLVIHGWFMQPRPFVSGPLSIKQVEAGIAPLDREISQILSQGLQLRGCLVLRIQISAAGTVKSARLMPHTLRSPDGSSTLLINSLLKFAHSLQFAKRSGQSVLTLPLVFADAT